MKFLIIVLSVIFCVSCQNKIAFEDTPRNVNYGDFDLECPIDDFSIENGELIGDTYHVYPEALRVLFVPGKAFKEGIAVNLELLLGGGKVMDINTLSPVLIEGDVIIGLEYYFSHAMVIIDPKNPSCMLEKNLSIGCPLDKVFLKPNNCGTCDLPKIYDPVEFTCEPCPDGTYYIAASGSCEACDSPKIYDPVEFTCEPCPAGTYYIAASGSCEACDPPKIYDPAEFTCEPCPAGTYYIAASGSCEACDPPKIYDSEHFKCDLCPAGKYYIVASGLCESCDPPKIYDPVAFTCEPCPEGTHYIVASGSCEACNPPKIYDPVAFICEACSEGTYYIAAIPGCGICGPDKIYIPETFECRDLTTNCVDIPDPQPGDVCLAFKDSFEREELTGGGVVDWSVVINDGGGTGSNVDAKIEDSSHLGPVIDEDKAVLFRGRKGGSVHEIYLIAAPIDFSNYDLVYVRFSYVPIDLEAAITLSYSGITLPESIRLDICEKTDYECGLSGADPEERIRDWSNWTEYWPQPWPTQVEVGQGLNIRAYTIDDWRTVEFAIDLVQYAFRKDKFVFKLTAAMDEGYFNDDYYKLMEDGIILDNVIVVGVKKYVP